MNWILAFNLDFTDPKPMSPSDAEKAAQELASKVSRQFTKGKTAYKELNEALSASYSEAVAVLTNPSSQSAEAQRIVFSIIADEASIFGSSVPQDQLVNIKKAVISKVKSDYSLPVYKFLDGSDKDATEARIIEIVTLGIEAAGAHVAGEDEENGYSSAAAKEKYSSFQAAFESANKEYAQINKSLGKLGAANLYDLIGGEDGASAKTLPYTTLQVRLNNLKGEFESGAEIENLKHLAADVFASEANRAKYDSYSVLCAKEDILKNLEKRSSNGTVNSKLFMEAALQLNALYSDTNQALLLLYGFADTKELDTGTDFGLLESVLAMREDAYSDRRQAEPTSTSTPSPEPASRNEPPAPDPRSQQPTPAASSHTSQSSQRSEEWRHKRPQDYTPEDAYNAYQAAKEWRDERRDAKQNRKAKQSKAEANKKKSKWVAGLLAIFLGTFGAQKFYLGHNAAGIATILISILGAIVAVGPFVTWAIGIVEGIKYLTKSPEQFTETYVIEGKTWF